MTEHNRPTLGRELAWPIGIAIAMLIVVLVNVTFIVIAVGGQDEVASSYLEERR